MKTTIGIQSGKEKMNASVGKYEEEDVVSDFVSILRDFMWFTKENLDDNPQSEYGQMILKQKNEMINTADKLINQILDVYQYGEY